VPGITVPWGKEGWMEGDTREHSCVQRNVLVQCTIAVHQQEVQLFPQLPLTVIKSLVVARDRCSEGVTPFAEIDSTSVEWARSVTPSFLMLLIRPPSSDDMTPLPSLNSRSPPRR